MGPTQKETNVSQLGCSACGGVALVILVLAAPARSAGRSRWGAEKAVVSSGESGSESVSARSAGGAQRKKLPTLQSRIKCQAEYARYQGKGMSLTTGQPLTSGSIVP
jgi:hypothetical protein